MVFYVIASAATAESANGLLGRWRVEPLPGGQSAQALQCRMLAEIEFRPKSVTMKARNGGAERGDDPQRAIAAGLMSVFTQTSGGARGSRASRASYEQDGGNWFVALRDFGGGSLVLNVHRRDDLMMEDSRCLSGRIGAEAAAPPSPGAGDNPPEGSARANGKPVGFERIAEGFGAARLGDLRQTLRQKGFSIAYDGAAQPPFSHALKKRRLAMRCENG